MSILYRQEQSRTDTTKTTLMDSIEAEIVIEKGTLEDADKFFRAATEGDVETIVSMLESGRASVNQTDIDDFTALMNAASQGKT